jgi:hypothetical protein
MNGAFANDDDLHTPLVFEVGVAHVDKIIEQTKNTI